MNTTQEWTVDVAQVLIELREVKTSMGSESKALVLRQLVLRLEQAIIQLTQPVEVPVKEVLPA